MTRFQPSRTARTAAPTATLLACLLLPAGAAVADDLTETQPSSVEVTWQDGAARFHMVNTTYRFEPFYPLDSVGEMRVLLLREQSDVAQRTDMEGPEAATVTVEAWAVDPESGRTPAWSISAEGETAGLMRLGLVGDFYRITRGGCCGAMDVNHVYSLESGRELFTTTAPPAGFEVPNSRGSIRLIGVHTAYSATDEETFGDDRSGLAVIGYASPLAPLSRALLTLDPSIEIEEVLSDAQPMLVEDGATEPDRFVELWDADGRTDAAALGGLSLRLDFAGNVVSIPIHDDALDLAAATLPEGFSLTALPPPAE